MNMEIERIVAENIGKLPAEVVHAINSTPWISKMRDIAKANDLNEKDISIFETETTLVVLGIESPKNYPANLIKEVGLSDKLAIKVAKAVDEQIIKPILDAIQKEETLKTIPEIKTEEQALVPSVIVENDLPMIVSGEKPFDAAQGKPKSSLTFEERKKLVPNLPDNKQHYDKGIDPYREPT